MDGWMDRWERQRYTEAMGETEIQRDDGETETKGTKERLRRRRRKESRKPEKQKARKAEKQKAGKPEKQARRRCRHFTIIWA